MTYISFKGKSDEKCYELFNKKYSGNLRISMNLIAGRTVNIYDIYNVAVILDKNIEDKKLLKKFGNINFLGTKDLIDKTINDIKSKGFKLEEIK